MNFRFCNREHTSIADDAGRFIPVDPGNSDYAALIASGTVIAPWSRFAGLTLDAAKQVLISEVDRAAEQLRISIAGTSDPTKLSVYTEKYQIALRALAGDVDALALLMPEAQARGESPETLAALVKTLGDQWRAASFAIEARSGAIKTAIAGLHTIEDAEAFDAGALGVAGQ